MISHSHAQQSDRLKELFKELKSEKTDSIRIYLMSEIAYEYESSSLDKAMDWYDKAIALAKKNNSNYWLSRNYGYKGIVYQFLREYDSSVYYNKQGISIAGRINDTLQQAKLYCNLGKTYFEADNLVASLSAFKKATYYAAKLKNDLLKATSFRGIGVCYDKMENTAFALKYHKMAMYIDQRLDSPNDLAMDYNNIAAAYMDLEKFDEANSYYEKTIAIYQQIGMVGEELGVVYNNQASAQVDQENHQKALPLFFKAKQQFLLSKDQSSVPFINKNIASSYLKLNNIPMARLYIDSALMKLSIKNNPRLTINAQLILGEILIKQNKHREAAALILATYNAKDSLETSFQKRELEELEIKFQSKEKDIKLKQSEAERKKKESELSLQISINQRRKLIVFGLIGIGLLLLILFLNLRRSNVRTKQANALIAHQNDEITASIRYAKNIQNAILPPASLLESWLSNHFVFYKPKDIVAGDFYWFEKVDDLLFFAAADCTGHGVPGAMVSVVCHNALNQAVREYGIIDSAEILNKTRELILKTFEKSTENIKDGMDISLCVMNLRTKNLQFSGANNSLLIVKKDTQEVIKLKADRQSIGFSEELKPFTSQVTQLSDGDRIYAFTDGFADQFGAKTGKKYKSKTLEAFILSIQAQAVPLQKESFSREFENWKGETEQTDDVCVLCVEV
jgi:serine phosphatase RsbU (regulator of sigma subunit)